jgi:L-amino acid N-acyltransferase YncA
LTLLAFDERCDVSCVDLIIRDAIESDAEAIAAIYAHHVVHGTASYDLEPPPTEFHRDKIRSIVGKGWPFLVAEADGRVAGYAYVTQFRDRAAYRFTGENSVYVAPEMMSRGIGKALLRALIDRSAAHGFRTIVAVIGGAEPASMALHAALGFAEVGRLRGVGWKKERWLDSVYMQRNC